MRSKAPESPNFDQLNQAYDVQGELAARRDARQFVAKRREDGTDVAIAVFQAPAGDQGNAISHLAADVNRLVGTRHQNLIPILEGQWIGTDAYAVVTPRIDAPTLEELLSRRDEDFSYPRIALILREVNAVIEWARAQKFVHRAVDLDTVHLDPGSDQLRVAFAVRALPRTGMPTAVDDARNIASLARAMLTRSPVAPQRDEQPLGELRPGLPTSLLQETENLLRGSQRGTPGQNGAPQTPDVTGYISRLAMAEDLKRGEMHLEKSRNAIKEAHRKAREEIDHARNAHKVQLANERAEHERLVAEQARTFAKERSEFEAELEKQRQALAKERETLANERAAHARAMEALAREREAHKRDCDALARERAAHKEEAGALTAQLAEHRRLMADERKRLAAQVDELQRRASDERQRLLDRVNGLMKEAAEDRKRMTAQLEAIRRQTAEERMEAAALLAARLEEQKRAAAEEKKRIADQLALEKRRAAEERKRLATQFAKTSAEPSASAPVPPVPKPQRPKPPKPPKPARNWGIHWRRSWNAPAAGAAVLLLLAGITLTASVWRGDGDRAAPRAGVTTPALSTTTPPTSSTAPNVIIDSLGGGVAPIVDSSRATVTARPRPTPRPEERRVTDVPPPPRPETAAVRVEIPSAFDLMGVSPIPLREGNTRLDSISRPARDSARREPRRDSLPRIDSIPRRDSTSRP